MLFTLQSLSGRYIECHSTNGFIRPQISELPVDYVKKEFVLMVQIEPHYKRALENLFTIEQFFFGTKMMTWLISMVQFSIVTAWAVN